MSDGATLRGRTSESESVLSTLVKPDRANLAALCVHRLFQARAARAPEAIALTVEGRHISYGELDERADRLARALRALGVGPEVPVGLFVERNEDLAVGILGILKAGGAYVPLDPAYPAERLAMILEDSRVPVLLSQRPLRDRLPEHEAFVVDLDDDAALDALPKEDDPDGGAMPGNLAYVIYTSGSTGRPKGVAVTHANVTRLFSATRPWFSFGPADVWTLFHSAAFDFSVWEFWGALIHGGRLVIVPYLVSRSPESFYELLRDEQVTVLNQTPSAFRQLIHAEDSLPEPAELALRLVIFGGEALELQALRPWFERHGDRSPLLVNMYGITETTVHVTYRPVTAADLESHPGSSPIGRPIPDLRLYLLDPRLEPVPVGVVGEIYVGGAGLARGYLDRPDLTADRFVPDPFGTRPGARLYKSGDLARRRPDGELEYVGRSDHQVKVRGFRIELGEIESALRRLPSVREAVVLAREDREGDRRLVAYLVLRGSAAPRSTGFRERLEPVLPGYMIPSSFVILPALPLTVHGKVDTASLPPPEGDRPALETAFVAPRNPAEESLASIWAAVLGLDRVGVHDNFFDLGGHSLLATQVISRVREAFGADVPLRALFEAPTVAGLVEKVEAARRTRRTTPIVPVDRSEVLPLSFAQQALWYLDRLAPGEPTFNVTAAVRVSGPLDIDALTRSFAELVRRHESLRTTFTTVEGSPVVVIAPEIELPVTSVDLSNLDPDRRNAEASRIASEEARRPFVLGRGPLVRATFLRLGERENAVLLTMHHIITDGWSFGVAASELAAIYEAFREGRPSPLLEPPIQYADYAAWQSEWLSGEVLDELLGYWKARLDGLPALELPTDRPRPMVRTERGAVKGFYLSPALSARLRNLGRREGVTPFMTLMAGFQILLHRLSGQEDFAVGSPIANRNRTEVEGLIGYFVNMLTLRADLSGDPTFRDLLDRVRETALVAYENQELPLDILVETLQPRRDPSRTPLFQVMFVLQNTLLPDVLPGDLQLGSLGPGGGTGTAKFDLSLGMVETEEGFSGSLEYSTDLFDDNTIERMILQFQTLLEQASDSPERRISALCLLPEAERTTVLRDWNRTEEAFPRDVCVHALIEAQAARTPDATALASAHESLSYRELNDRVDRLAAVLRNQGVGPEAKVGLVIDRSPEFFVAILATLKAGGAYVPLDPGYPPERLNYLIEDAGLTVLLTRRSFQVVLPQTYTAVLFVDDAGVFAHPVGESPVTEPGPENPAYVIYTSGSTGLPKGVVVPHRSLVNHNLAAVRLFDLRAEDRVLQFGAIGFDLVAEEIFPAWICGAAVVLRDDGFLDPARFARKVARERITVLDLPTAFWHAWVRELEASGENLPDSLRLVVVGGEEASAASLATWRKISGDRVRWINTYGPTEATIIATAYEPYGDPGTRVPIGRPIANMRTYVLDSRYQPMPIGVPGELYLGGEGVARGYLGRPTQTADRFPPDPFGPEPGGRLYRTGDLARWRPDGQLEFLGRVDDQVKVRGYRVELGEIEAALIAFAGVSGAVVIARTDADGDAALAAFVTGRDLSAERLRESLKGRLPRFMVPASVNLLDAFPLTATGKVDRLALASAAPTPQGCQTTRPPRDEIEVRLGALFEEVLNVRPVGVSDDFFDLGGHSLLAVRLVARIDGEFGREISLADLLRGPTVEDVASLLRVRESARQDAGSWSPLVAIRSEGRREPFFCVHPAGGVAYGFLELARVLPEDRPFYGIRASGLDGERPPLGRVEDMAASYIQALRQVQPEGPYHLGGWSLGGLVAFEMARQFVKAGQKVATASLIDVPAPGSEGLIVTPLIREMAAEIAGLEVFGEPGADPLDDAIALSVLLGEMAEGGRRSIRSLIARFRGLDPASRREAILRGFDLDKLYRHETGPERMRNLLRVLRANVLAGARYAPDGPYPGRLIVFRASDRGKALADPSLGWGRLARGGATNYSIPGNHASILARPGVERLAEALRTEMDRAGGEPR